MFEYLKALEHVSNVQDLLDLNDFMDDEKFGEALELAMQCVANPNISVATARKALLLMQSYSLYFKMRGNVYMTIKQGKAGTEENKKKNVYFSMAGECHELAQTLKYLAKETFGA